MTLTFHIIYTAGTVKPLQLLLFSLLKWSDCHFRLVANGCSSEEQTMLQRLCDSDARLTYVPLPTQQVMVHGEALNYLQSQNQTDYFCFMDSDIYAIEQFLPAFLSNLNQYSGLFSGMPIRYPQTGVFLSEEIRLLYGRYTHTKTQLCLGTTFFAIYDNQVVTEVRQATGISFTKYWWKDLSKSDQKQLEALGMKCDFYDTAKLLNVVLQQYGYALRYQPCDALQHIGGVSRFVRTQPHNMWRQLRTNGMYWLRRLTRQKITQPVDPVMAYFSQLLLAFADNQPVPAQPAIINAPCNAWAVHTVAELLALHAEFSRQPLG